MSEQEIREGMLLAVWDEPPLDFDPDTLIRRVEQKKSRRRALVTVGVATAMIAVASFSLPGLLPRDQDARLGAETQSSVPATPTVDVERKARRIGDVLAASVERMTGHKDVYASFRTGSLRYPPYTSTTETKRPGDPDYSGYLGFTDMIGPTALEVVAGKNQESSKVYCQGASACRDVTQGDGTVVTEIERTEGSELTASMAVRTFQNGYTVRISSYNYNPTTGQGLRQSVPVRVPVLTALVMDPSITWE
ncbi:hypothetical protein PV646_09320 [Streptomyces sp. ID05-26A]|nr:hypothetical protein [Streptomyces sp. ID05-26A]